MASKEFLQVADIIADVHLVAGVILNALLLYVIRKVSQTSVGSYKYLLGIFAAFDIFLCILHKVAKPGAIIVGSTFGCVTDTPLESRVITSFYCACFTIPFALMNIHFLYRFWSIRFTKLLHNFTNKKFIVGIAMFPIGEFIIWFLLVYLGLTGDVDEPATILLSTEYAKKYGRLLKDGWISKGFNLRIFLGMIAYDIIMIISFTIAIVLGSLTFYYIKRAHKLSAQSRNMQWKLFIAVSAQTFVPTLFVYIPYFCIINFPFFGIPLFYVDDAWMRMTACFPAWDAVIIIVLIKDYRVGLFKLFMRKRTVKTNDNTWMGVSTYYAPTMTAASDRLPSSPNYH
ncbi:str-99 [Pristionchus pacificus]|uniref:Str-99 n=1 Tax=Pristionchus pacificus TaxID=54126 RepID=A0A2A6CNR2_PRIPA|nr:str-99 [Pristionchus pacificus]|eukprot:PDM79834.1 str-99 [Pristionchus pacificus]